MHEFSLVADLIDVCSRQAAGRPVSVVRVRHASTIPELTLRQAFAMLTEGGEFATTQLDAEPFDIRLQCACGFDGSLAHDDLIDAAMAVCPSCGDVTNRARTAEIELLEIRVASST